MLAKTKKMKVSEVFPDPDSEADERRRAAYDVGRRIAFVRQENGLVQRQVAEMVGCGSQAAYARWESGGNLADLLAMRKFAAIFGVTLDYIYNGDTSGLKHDLAQRLTDQHPELVMKQKDKPAAYTPFRPALPSEDLPPLDYLLEVVSASKIAFLLDVTRQAVSLWTKGQPISGDNIAKLEVLVKAVKLFAKNNFWRRPNSKDED